MINEILRPTDPLFPLPFESVRQALKEITGGTGEFLEREEASIIKNDGLYDYLTYRKSIAESFLDTVLYRRGALFTHKVLRIQAEKKRRDLPQLPMGFGRMEESERQLLAYYVNHSVKLTEEADLNAGLEAIAGSSIMLSVVAGAIDVYFPLKYAIIHPKT